MPYDWNPQRWSGIALVFACTIGVAACGHHPPNASPAKGPSGAPAFPAVANVAAAKGTPIAREAIDRIQPGMTDSEVKKILGSPAWESALGGERVQVIWTGPDNQAVHIVFEKGKVIQKSSAGQQKETSHFTQANLDQVKTGMTEAQVVQLLGPSKGDFTAGPTHLLTWEDGSREVMIHFLNGKVLNKFVNPR
jgi:outer membrane protein assembly factor BamE (lipoprotein component of BamABCDE complex)